VKKVERVFDHPVLALRTLREVRLLAHFRHCNVLGFRGLFLEGPDFEDAYLCLDMMDCDLHHLIHNGKERLSDYQVQMVLYQVLRGLLALRRAHVVHRDLKPGNVLIRTSGGEVRIADLGLARSIDAGEEDTHDYSVLTEYVVTRYYRAPEVVLTATKYTYAVDMWSTGCILGEMLTRRPIFAGKDALDQIRKIVNALGRQTPEDMDWIPRSSSAWMFVERCNQSVDGEALRSLLQSQGANPLAMSLLEEMLRFDPSRRVSVEVALQHSYLSAFGPAEDPEVAAANAVEPVDWSFDRNLCFDEHGEPKAYDKQSFRRAFLDADFLLAPPVPALPLEAPVPAGVGHERGGGATAAGAQGMPTVGAPIAAPATGGSTRHRRWGAK